MANICTKYRPPPITAFYGYSTPATFWVVREMPFLTSVAVSGLPAWPNFSFGEGVVGIAYSQDFDLYPALSPTTCTLVSGSLPPGLSLNNVSADIGRLSGTPTTPGSYSFTLRATNLLGTADKVFTVLVVLPGSGGSFPFWG